MAHALARLQLRTSDYLTVLGPDGQPLRVSDADIDAMLGLIGCFGCGERVSIGQLCPFCGRDNSLDDEADPPEDTEA